MRISHGILSAATTDPSVPARPPTTRPVDPVSCPSRHPCPFVSYALFARLLVFPIYQPGKRRFFKKKIVVFKKITKT
jgi:hypothetical protein